MSETQSVITNEKSEKSSNITPARIDELLDQIGDKMISSYLEQHPENEEEILVKKINDLIPELLTLKRKQRSSLRASYREIPHQIDDLNEDIKKLESQLGTTELPLEIVEEAKENALKAETWMADTYNQLKERYSYFGVAIPEEEKFKTALSGAWDTIASYEKSTPELQGKLGVVLVAPLSEISDDECYSIKKRIRDKQNQSYPDYVSDSVKELGKIFESQNWKIIVTVTDSEGIDLELSNTIRARNIYPDEYLALSMQSEDLIDNRKITNHMTKIDHPSNVNTRKIIYGMYTNNSYYISVVDAISKSKDKKYDNDDTNVNDIYVQIQGEFVNLKSLIKERPVLFSSIISKSDKRKSIE